MPMAHHYRASSTEDRTRARSTSSVASHSSNRSVHTATSSTNNNNNNNNTARPRPQTTVINNNATSQNRNQDRVGALLADSSTEDAGNNSNNVMMMMSIPPPIILTTQHTTTTKRTSSSQQNQTTMKNPSQPKSKTGENDSSTSSSTSDDEMEKVDTTVKITTKREGEGGGHHNPIDDLRNTPEYAVAWDLEVWRASQQSRIAKQLQDAEAKALDELAKRILLRDKEEQARWERRHREMLIREKDVADKNDALEKVRGRLQEHEHELRRQTEQLETARRRMLVETDERVQRARDDAAHKLELQASASKHLESELRMASERVQAQNREYQSLWEEFSQFRTKSLAVGEEGFGGGSGGGSGSGVQGKMESLRNHYESQLLLQRERNDRQISEMRNALNQEMVELRNEARAAGEVAAAKKAQCKTLHKQLAKTMASLEKLQQQQYVGGVHQNNNNNENLAQQQQFIPGISSSPVLESAHRVLQIIDPQNQQQQQQQHIHEHTHHYPNQIKHLESSINNNHQRGSLLFASRNVNVTKNNNNNSSANNNLKKNVSNKHESEITKRNSNNSVPPQIQQMLNEREVLIRESHGVYNETSPIIVAMTQKIDQMMRDFGVTQKK